MTRQREPWVCRGCGAQLGSVMDGVLRPMVVPGEIDQDGVVLFACAACGRRKLWFPVRAPRVDREDAP